MAKTRAIRFSDLEDSQIEEFLKANPFLDFSSLARLSIMGFIKEPKIEVQAIKQISEKKDKKVLNGQPRI